MLGRGLFWQDVEMLYPGLHEPRSIIVCLEPELPGSAATLYTAMLSNLTFLYRSLPLLQSGRPETSFHFSICKMGVMRQTFFLKWLES